MMVRSLLLTAVLLCSGAAAGAQEPARDSATETRVGNARRVEPPRMAYAVNFFSPGSKVPVTEEDVRRVTEQAISSWISLPVMLEAVAERRDTVFTYVAVEVDAWEGGGYSLNVSCIERSTKHRNAMYSERKLRSRGGKGSARSPVVFGAILAGMIIEVVRDCGSPGGR